MPINNSHKNTGFIWRRIAISLIIAIWWGTGKHYYSFFCVFLSCVGTGLTCYICLTAIKQKVYLWISGYFFCFWMAYLAPFASSEPVRHAYRIFPSDYEEIFSIIALLSMLATYIGYISIGKKLKITSFFDNEDFSIKSLQKLCYLIFLMYIFLSFTSIFRTLSGTIQRIANVIPGLYLAVATIFYCRGGRSIIVLALTIFTGIMGLLIGVSGLLYIAILLLFLPSFLVLILYKKYKILLIFSSIIVIVLSPGYLTRGEDRLKYWKDREYDEGNLTYRLQLGAELLHKSYSVKTSEITTTQKENAKSRNELVTYFGQAIIYHEIRKHPYHWGETFYWLPIVWLPRKIFPWKPRNTLSTLTAMEYGCSNTLSASMNFPVLVEFYINFGFWGIVPLSLLLGIGMRYCVEKCGRGEGDLNLICLLCILFPLSRVEGNITLIYGEIINMLIVFWVISLFLRKKGYHTPDLQNLGKL